jgi:hypothetical protein
MHPPEAPRGILGGGNSILGKASVQPTHYDLGGEVQKKLRKGENKQPYVQAKYAEESE